MKISEVHSVHGAQEHEASTGRRRYQFRLRTLFLLITLAACVLLGTHIWHYFWLGERGRYEADAVGSMFAQCERARFLALSRFTPLLAGIVFCSGWGVWYGVRRHDWGVMACFALPFLYLSCPPLGSVLLFLLTRVIDTLLWRFGMFQPPTGLWLIPVALFAGLISFWPLVYRRYALAGTLWLFSMFWISTIVCYSDHWMRCLD